MKAGDLEISPKELRFRLEPKKQLPSCLTLINRSDERIAFKVKTTAPKKYCVKPSAGVVEPHLSLQVQVLMQVPKDPTADAGDCKDKFLVQSTACPAGWNPGDKNNEMFDKKSNAAIVEEKLRVVLDGPAAPPSPVPEGRETHDTDGSASTAFASTAGRGDKAADFADENRRLREKLALMELKSSDAGVKDGGFQMMHLILVALLAFLIGYFF